MRRQNKRVTFAVGIEEAFASFGRDSHIVFEGWCPAGLCEL